LADIDPAVCFAALARHGYRPLEGNGPPEKWEVDGVWARGSYEHDFYDLLADLGARTHTRYFDDFLKARKTDNKANVLDLFGTGFFVEEPGVNSVTGLRWGPFDVAKVPKEFRPKQVPTEVLGDIFNPATWDKLDQSMRDRSIPSMDLIVMRPEGGWYQNRFTESAEGNVAGLTFIIQNARKRLSPDGRFLFTVKTGVYLPEDLSKHPMFQELARDIEQNSPFKLVLKARTNGGGSTYRIDGALIPKSESPD